MASRDYSSFYIGGKWLPAQSDAVFDVVSPRSEECIGSVPAASPADIDAAVGAARHAFDETDWSRRPHAELGELTISVDPSQELPAEILATTERTRWEA